MRSVFVSGAIQVALLFLLIAKDRNDGGKELFRRQKWTGSDAAIVIFGSVLLRFAGELASWTRIFGLHPEVLVPYYAPHLVLLAIVWIMFRLRIRQPMSALGFSCNSLVKAFFLFATAILLLSRLLVYVDFGRHLFIWIEYAFHSLIIIPVVEEIVFRGVLYSPYRKKFGQAGAVLITATLFAAAHGRAEVGPNIAIFFWGVVFAWVYEKSESLSYPMVIHSSSHIPSLILCPL